MATSRFPRISASVSLYFVACVAIWSQEITSIAIALAAPNGRTIETIAGDGHPGFSATQVNWVLGIAMGPDGALYFSDSGNHVIRRLDLKTRGLTVIAGNGKDGYEGDGGLATDASLKRPLELQFDRAGNLYFTDSVNNLVRRVDAKTKMITTVAGTGKIGFAGDGGPAVQAQFDDVGGLAFAKDGSLLICDRGNHRIRRVDLTTGRIETFAGTGEGKPTPDGAPIQGTPLTRPRTMIVASNGDIYVATPTAIYKMDMKANRYVHIAGKGEALGPAGIEFGNGPGKILPPIRGDAKQATLSAPTGLALSHDGKFLYVVNTETHRLLLINLKKGTIETIAGTGERGDDSGLHNSHTPGNAISPDGDALKCKLSRPHGIIVDGNGMVYFTDAFSNRVRMLR